MRQIKVRRTGNFVIKIASVIIQLIAVKLVMIRTALKMFSGME